MAQFARTWRPRQFEDVVGQELVVSLLRNTLYRDSLFPVYLFAGQRGCGKTTLARIFATAINCERRVEFAQSPHAIAIPCRTCYSCQAMHDGSHTDFHEIDAASHTGVDHVRALLEATVLAPQMGSKKIYLIDEVHMLSRAACNALLKTLEEPLESVIFLLATTDPHKIIDTVRSRCFQLFLKPLAPESIIGQLVRVCEKENVVYDRAALSLITGTAEGSLRDAINSLERVIMAYGRVSEAEVTTVIGMVTTAEVLDLFEALAAGEVPRVLAIARGQAFLLAGVSQACRMVCEVFRMLVWLHHGVVAPEAVLYEQRLRSIVSKYPLQRVIAAWDAVYAMEQRMVKSAHPQAAWELTLVKICSGYVAPVAVPTEAKKNELKKAPSEIVKTVANESLPAGSLPAVAEVHVRGEAKAGTRNGGGSVPSGEALWNQVLAHMQHPAEQNFTPKPKAMISEAPNMVKPQRAQAPAASSIVHDDITKKMLTLFPGTLTQEFEGNKT